MSKYLSFDIEATGLREHDLIIEFAAVPFDTKDCTIAEDLTFHYYVQCPDFESLKPNLDPWVIQHNEELIRKAHQEGLSIPDFKTKFENYLTSQKVTEYFNNEKIVLFGKSMSAIDLPFLNRDLGWDFMRKYFLHRQLDLSCLNYSLVDLNYFPSEINGGSKLMEYYGMGEVAHTALEDAINTAKLYFHILKQFAK